MSLTFFFLVFNCIFKMDGFSTNMLYDMSNVVNAIPDPDSSTDYVTYLGNFDNVNECINTCIQKSSSSNECYSITYFNDSYNITGFAQHCYGLFGEQYGSLWTPVFDKDAISAQILFPCKSNRDCSLNGKCESNGNCTCNKGWKGYRCSEMNFVDANKLSGFVYPYNVSSWGGAMMTDNNSSDNNTKYNMFLSRFDNHCGVKAWVPNSAVVRAVSTNGFNSEYEYVETIVPHFSHEPDIVKGPNGEIVLYYITTNTTQPECVCQDGSTPESCQPYNPSVFTQEMIYSNSVNGPWSEPTLINTVGENDPNLAGVILKNGSFIGLSRDWENGYSSVYLLSSPDWKNGDSYVIGKTPLFPQLTGGGTEDPFVYQDCNGYFHAILNNQAPNYAITVCGGHAYSQDGINWVYTGFAFGNTVTYTDGTNITFSRRERPHFVFDNDECTPIALTTGAQYGGEYGDATQTQLQPVI